MKGFAFSLLLFIYPCVSYADWDKTNNTDTITNVHTLSVTGTDYYQNNSVGLRCDISGNVKRLMVTYSLEKVINVPNSEVDFYLKVDENDVIYLESKLYSNSYDSGYVRSDDYNSKYITKLIKQMISGNFVVIKVKNKDSSEVIDYKVDLKNFTNFSKDTLSACDYYKNKKKITVEDKNRLNDIDKNIDRLKSEKESILSKY
ncbi:hypothetical protein [Shewanella fodinae]|uniref:hypothetical protein n=1 Tax=Shewanella fodinae TaxID=552357 RepID=UPI001672B72E|nr:hypothetical protein [Shewanella fodinae]MCL2905201.1 hypothetical protein [Shewanella fodinae]GGY87829.1 hypothetical protein GCM10007169_01240 [Shewanella fodinae]